MILWNEPIIYDNNVYDCKHKALSCWEVDVHQQNKKNFKLQKILIFKLQKHLFIWADNIIHLIEQPSLLHSQWCGKPFADADIVNDWH